jgi:hypothetical protein
MTTRTAGDAEFALRQAMMMSSVVVISNKKSTRIIKG